MASPLVQTKLYIPKVRRGLVARPRLSETLSRGSQARLTLVSAPAGFGKTTLVAAWLATAEDRSVAWLSLEEADRRPASFWTYVAAALDAAVPGVGTSALALLQAPQTPIETVLATLLNGLGAVPNEIDLVLDDYHLVDGPGIQPGMAFVLDHLPPHVHIVISTRADPALPLARLRARGELVEIRSADLRFTPEEATVYLNDVAGLALTSANIAALEGRTEGWVAALQLAALSIRGRDDVAGFIASFAGDDRYIVDYLVEEVLARQPDDVRSFLIQTSILDRLSGPLCDAVTGQDGGKAMLESLERANLFVVPLDDRRHWYRYHHLFADVLRARLLDERSGEVTGLHRRASGWYDQNGEPPPAVRHAVAAGDVEQAARLMELAIPGLLQDRQEATIRGWLGDIPGDIVRVRPVLGIGFVGALMALGEHDQVEQRLQDVERWLDPAARRPAEMIVVDEKELSRLPAAVEVYRSGLALLHGDASATISHADRAIDRAAVDDHVTRASASALSGLALWGSGDLDAAHRAYSVTVEMLQRVGHFSDVLGCSITLADIRITQGRLGDALRTYEQALLLASHESGTVLRGTADMYVGMSQIACERGDLDAAARHLQHSRDLGDHLGLPQNPYRWRVAMARIREAHGDLDGAQHLLEEADRVYTGDFLPNVRPILALRARVLVAQGNLSEAIGWARGRGLSADDDLSYLRECEHITLAGLLLAQYTAQYTAQRSESAIHDASQLLARLLTAAEEGARTGSVIEILVLQALAQQAQGDVRAALASLERALTLAEPEGYVRVFTRAGPAIVPLLKVVATQRVTLSYVHRIRDHADSGVPGRGTQVQPLAGSLVEPLSERELEVLRLLASDLGGPEIARELRVSLNTLRTHTKNIYAKLGVSSRRAAVRQAGELNLRSRTRDR